MGYYNRLSLAGAMFLYYITMQGSIIIREAYKSVSNLGILIL